MGARAKNFHTELMARMGYDAEARKIQELFFDGRRDEAILAAWDFTRWRPAVLCVETSVHSAGGPSVQRNAISTTMLAAGYRSYAHTGINTIFIDSSR